MSGTSLAGLLIICGVVVAGLATWLVLVFWANRHPFWKGRRQSTRPGGVRGGAFLGEGRALTPRRDAEPDLDREWPEARNEPIAPDDATHADSARPRTER
jgi:hypothetical protein